MPAQREVTLRWYRPLTLVLQPSLAPSLLLHPPWQLEEDYVPPLLPPHSWDLKGTSFSCQHPWGWLLRRGQWWDPSTTVGKGSQGEVGMLRRPQEATPKGGCTLGQTLLQGLVSGA